MLPAMVDEPIAFVRAEECPAARSTFWGAAPSWDRDAGVRFERGELDRILKIYGRMVIAGEWRDYALDFTPDAAVFSVFRRASEAPLYAIEKRPKLRNCQGQFAVLAASGHVLKRGDELVHVLHVFDRKLIKAVRPD